jgi:hypothetical protein
MPTTPTCPPLDYIAEVAALLSTCGVTKVGAEFISDNKAPHQYTWIPVGEVWSGDSPADPSNMGAFDTSFVVHVYGKDYVSTWRMRHALLTALRHTAQGFFTVGGAEWPVRDKGTSGCVCLQTVSVRIPIPAQAYPTTLGDEIADEEPLTAQATSIGSLTSTFDH